MAEEKKKEAVKESPPKRVFLVCHSVGAEPVRIEGVLGYWHDGVARTSQEMNMTEAGMKQLADSLPQYFSIEERGEK